MPKTDRILALLTQRAIIVTNIKRLCADCSRRSEEIERKYFAFCAYRRIAHNGDLVRAHADYQAHAKDSGHTLIKAMEQEVGRLQGEMDAIDRRIGSAKIESVSAMAEMLKIAALGAEADCAGSIGHERRLNAWLRQMRNFARSLATSSTTQAKAA